MDGRFNQVSCPVHAAHEPNFAVLGLSFVISGPITDAVGARWVYAAASVTILVGAAVAARLVRGIDLPAAKLADAA